MVEYENYRQQMRLPKTNQDMAREIAKQRKARREAFLVKLLQKPAFERLKNRIMIRRLNRQLSKARQYSIESLSKVYVFKQGMDFVCLRSKDLKNNTTIHKSYKNTSKKDWITDNAIAVYWNGKCVEHKNFTFKINF